MRWLVISAAMLVAVGCDDDVQTTGGGGNGTSSQGGDGAGGMGSGATSAGGNGAGASGGMTGTGGMATGGAGGAGGVGMGGAGGMGSTCEAVTPSATAMNMYVNCQPIVAPDPIIGSFDATYVNAGAIEGCADIKEASITFVDGNQTLVWTVNSFAPTSSGPVPAGQTTMVTHTKMGDGTGVGDGGPCSYCTLSSTMRLDVTFSSGGSDTVSTAGPVAVNCVF